VNKRLFLLSAIALLTILVITIVLISQPQKKERITFWKFGNHLGWYPLQTANQKAVYVGKNRAFINKSSVIVDCDGYRIDVLAGAGILLSNNKVAVLRLADKTIQQDLSISSVFSFWDRTAVTDQQILVPDLKFLTDEKGSKSQC